jgi:hypothetical protein
MTHSSNSTITCIFHLPENSIKQMQIREGIWKPLKSGFSYTIQWVALGKKENNHRWFKGTWIDSIKDTKPSSVLNRAFEQSQGSLILYIDNSENEVSLKYSCANIFLLAAERYPNTGMFYADYDLLSGDEKYPIRLLKHHSGRVRDNQDHGKIFLFRKEFINQTCGFDETLKYHFLYDIRLKISERGTITHISNKKKGSLYEIATTKEDANVFDYLMEEKDSQIEAESVFTNHLKRTGAFLGPGKFINNRPLPLHNPTLKASVIIPVNNRPEFIGTALDSCLNQSVQNIEMIVVVNGGNDDPTVEAVQRYQKGGDKYVNGQADIRLEVIDINNIGFCLNMGVSIAKGEFYVQLDSDDRLKQNAIEKILEMFDSDPKIGIVIGSYNVWELENDGTLVLKKEIPTVTHKEWTKENGRNNLLRVGGAGAPRSIPIQLIKDIGYFGMNEEPYSRNYAEDYELVIRISESYQVGRIFEPIYDVIRHSGGTDHSIDQETIDRNDEAKDWMRKIALDRRIKLNQSQNEFT